MEKAPGVDGIMSEFIVHLDFILYYGILAIWRKAIIVRKIYGYTKKL